MKVFLSDGQLLKRGGRLQLVKLDEQWHVAGEGYLCMVASYEEGSQLTERLRAEGRERGVAIEMQQKQVRASQPTPHSLDLACWVVSRKIREGIEASSSSARR